MTDYNQHKIMVRLLIHVLISGDSLQMQPSPVNKRYNATQNWRKNKSTTLFADQIHTYDCTQYCIIECLKILIIYDDTPLKVLCETKYTYTTKSNRINRNEIHIHHKINKINRNKVQKATYLSYTELFVCLQKHMLSAPVQFVSLPEQLGCATEQLQNCSGIVRMSFGAVNKCPGTVCKSSWAVSKCSGAVT